MLEILLCITGTNHILKCIKIDNVICNFSQYCCFTVFFLSNKCSLCEQNRFIKKSLLIVMFLNFWQVLLIIIILMPLL